MQPEGIRPSFRGVTEALAARTALDRGQLRTALTNVETSINRHSRPRAGTANMRVIRCVCRPVRLSGV